MFMFERFRKGLAAAIAPQAKPADPQTRIVGGGTDQQHARLGFGTAGDREKDIAKWRLIYLKGGLISDAIDAYPLFTLSPGWELHCEDGKDALKAKVQDWLDQPHIDLDMVMWQGILDSVLCKTAFQEIIPTKSGDDIWGVVPRDASSFRIKYDEFGRITGYTQLISTGTGQFQEKPIDADRMLTITLFPVPGDVYGASILERAYDDIQRDVDVIDSITKAIHRHGTPKQQWAIGDPENRASLADLNAVEKNIEKIRANTDFVTTHDTKINALDTTGVANIDVYSNVSLQRLACALGVPEEMLGLGRGSTEATANVRMQAFLDKISTIQSIIARTYSRQLIDRITKDVGAVWIEFNDRPQDFLKLAQAIAALRNTPDPDSVAPADWAREQFGIPKDEAAEAPGTPSGSTPYPGGTSSAP